MPGLLIITMARLTSITISFNKKNHVIAYLINYPIMFDKKKILGKAAKLLKAAQHEGEIAINASKPLAKKALGKISEEAVNLGQKGKKIAEDMNSSPQAQDRE